MIKLVGGKQRLDEMITEYDNESDGFESFEWMVAGGTVEIEIKL